MKGLGSWVLGSSRRRPLGVAEVVAAVDKVAQRKRDLEDPLIHACRL